MHGQKREEYKARFTNPEIVAKLETKALQWNSLFSELLVRRENLSPLSLKFDLPKPGPILSDTADNVSKQNSNNDKKTTEQPNLEITSTLNSKLLLVNPDPLVLWNIRRELLLLLASNNQDTMELFDLQKELNLTMQCLERNPKAYGIWLHRKWTLQYYFNKEYFDKNECMKILQYELHLCKEFLNLDERNFHCWNYRRFIVSILGVLEQMEQNKDNSNETIIVNGSWDWLQKELVVMGPQMVLQSNASSSISSVPSNMKDSCILQTEWDYTTLKIQANFSNYSAFHYRSKLLPLLVQQDKHQMKDKTNTPVPWYEIYHIKVQYAQEELELIHQAIFTEPDDQTSWWYHRFIVDSFLESPPLLQESTENDKDNHLETFSSIYIELMQSELEQLNELIEMEEGNCKWGLLASHMIYGKLRLVLGEEEEAYKAEQWNCLDLLEEIDPDRKKRYQSMRK